MSRRHRLDSGVVPVLSMLCLALTIGWPDWRDRVSARSPSSVGYGAEPPSCDCPAGDRRGKSAISLTEGNLTDTYKVTTVQSAFGPTIDLVLLYNSANADGSRIAADLGLGLGWTHSYLSLLFTQTPQPDALFRLDADGRVTRFTPNGDGTFSPNTGYFETLSTNPDGSYTVREKGGRSWTFAVVEGPPLAPPFNAGATYRLVSLSDRVGNTTTLTYTDGLLTAITDTFARAVQLAYDVDRRLQSTTDPAGRVTTFAYDAEGHLHTITDPELHTRTHTYNAAHQLTQKVDRDGRAFTYVYVEGKPVSMQDDQGDALFSLTNPTNWAIDPAALQNGLAREYVPSTTTETDGNGHAWQHMYEVNGYLTESAAPDGASTAYVYDAVTLRLAAVTDGNNHTASYSYDALGNRVRLTNALAQETTYTYEPEFNQLASVTDANNRTTTYEYDAAGNRTREVDALGAVRSWTYDGHGNVLSETNQRGHKIRYQYDATGNRVTMKDALGRVTTYTHDLLGNLLSETDPNLHTTTYEYDGLDRRIREINPLAHVEETAYDGEGHVALVTDRNGHTTEFVYDSRGRRSRTIDPALQVATTIYDANDAVVAETDPGGHTTTYVYDTRNRLITTTDALTQSTGRTYDSVGNLLTETDANGHTTTYTYDELNRRRTRTDAEGSITEWRYDMVGPCPDCTGPARGSNLATQMIDAAGKVIYFKYDGLDRLLREVRKEGDTADLEDSVDAVTQYSFDAASNQIAMTHPAGQTTLMEYDRLERRSVETNGAGEVRQYHYDRAGNLRRVASPNGNVTSYAYDAADRLVRVNDGGGLVRKTTYDPKGNWLTESNGVGATTSFTYDILDRLISRTDPLGHGTMYDYDPDGNRVEVVDREGRRLIHTFDDVHRLVRIREEGAPDRAPIVRKSDYEYDPVGNLTRVIDPNGRPTTYTHDRVDRRITETYSDAAPNVRSFTYDGVGNLASRTDQQGRTTGYRYNDLHFLVQRDYPTDPDDLYTYDPAGRLLTANRGTWQIALAYDAADRLIESIQNGQTVRTVYDIPGRTRQLTYPSGRVLTEGLDARDRKASVAENGTTLVTYRYDHANRVKARQYLNGVATSYAHDANDRPTQLRDRTSAATLLRLEYTYDREGNKLSERHRHNLTASETYQYDGVHRLVHRKVGEIIGASVANPSTQTAYSLDLLGNWNEKTTDGLVETRAHNAVNETTAIGTSVILYDDTGNLIDDSVRRYEYDEENRLVRVVRTADAAVLGEYHYDALGRRVRKLEPQTAVETRYFYDALRVVEEQDSAGITRATYVHGNYLDEVVAMDRGGQRLYYHHNTLFSVSALSNASGVLVEGYRYDAYGRQTVFTPGANGAVDFGADDVIFVGGSSSLGNPYTFTGRELDAETGLLHYRARSYHPEHGRFMQRDPIGYADGLNLYMAYFVPNGLDPLGLRDRIRWGRYLKDFFKNHPGLTDAQKQWVTTQMARGCVGATCVNVGASEDLTNCYDTKARAEARHAEMAKTKTCCPLLFSIHFWNDTGSDRTNRDLKIDPTTGKADLSNWDEDGRPPGPWHRRGRGGTNFDYGFVNADGKVTHANHYHNPDRDRDGVGDYYPGDDITRSTIYKSSLAEWQGSYSDFNAEVWCVQCKGDYSK